MLFRSAHKDERWAGNVIQNTSVISVGDSVPGNTRNEVYTLKAGVEYEIGDHWAIGAAID